MFPPIPAIINVDMIYQYQPNPFVGFGFNPTPMIQQMPQQNPFLSQLIHTQQQIINSQILQNASISASMFAQHHQQQQQQHHQQQQLQITSSSSLPTSSTTEINDNDPTSFQHETNFGGKIKFATWNVRSAVEMDKRNTIDKCLNEKMVQIACIQETKLQMTLLETANYRWHFINRKTDHNVHCGTAILVKHSFKGAVTNFEAVTGNILSCFVRSKESTILLISAHLTEGIGTEIEFDRLKNFLKLYESLPTIILGDFNAQLGKLDLINADNVFMGRFLYHDRCNANGRLLKDLASEAKLFIKNTFRSHKIYKWKFILTTCRLKDKTSNSKAIEAQIDHVLTSRDGIVFVKMLRGYYRNNIKTDHKMIVADVEIRSNDRETGENVIDLSLEDDVTGNSQDVETRSGGTQEDSTEENRYTRKELAFREKLSQHGKSLTNERPISTTKQNTINQTSHPSTIDIESGNLEVKQSVKMQISPGEPVPPGFEDVVKPVAELQVILSKYRTSPMIGLEYIIELIMGDRRPRTYHCAMCDKICDTKDIIEHIKSYDHRCKYLDKHFSTVMLSLSQYRTHLSARNVLAGVIEAVCDSIEDAYGRLMPNVFENNDYTANRAMYMKKLTRERHFDEKSGLTFVGVIDHKAIQSAFEKLAETMNKPITSIAKRTRIETPMRSKRNSFDSISSNDSMSTSNKQNKLRYLDLISSDSDDDVDTKKRKRSNSHRSTSYYKNDEPEDFKYERYRILADPAVKNLKTMLQEYEKYPEKHPMYPNEWKRYWTRRSKELESVGTDPLTFDFSAEWSKYWLRRLRELYDNEIVSKKFEIRKKLKLSDDHHSSSSSYNESSSSSSFCYNKDNVREEKSRMKTQYSADKMMEEENGDDEPLTVISALRLLAALEDLLGATLGKKVVDLLSKAVHLEKLKANLADDVLMNEENSVLLDTVKEKLKGLIIAKIVNNKQINAVRRAIRNVESIVAVIDAKISVSQVKDEMQPNKRDEKMSNEAMRTGKQNPQMNCERRGDIRSEISRQIATAFVFQKINILKERLEELTDNYASQSKESSETPYLFGVRVSQTNEFNYSKSQQNTTTHLHSSLHTQPLKKQVSVTDGGGGFAFNMFDRNARNADSLDNSTFNITVNAARSNNLHNRTNNLIESYSQQNSSQSMTISKKSNQSCRSSDQFSQQNSSHQSSFTKSLPQQSSQPQRFQHQNSASYHHPQSQNSSNKHMNKKNHFNQRKPNHLQIWDSETTTMTNKSNSQGFDNNGRVNSIWDTNPMQNQNQQQSNQRPFKQISKQPQSHYNNFYQQNSHSMISSHQPAIWDHQFSQQQNSRNSRHH